MWNNGAVTHSRLVAVVALLLAACGGGGEESAPDAGWVTADEPRLDSALSPADCIRSADCAAVMVTAHRGDQRLHPENSLAALRAAAEVGVEFVEVDVRDTGDDVLVLMHDSDVDRTTDGSGEVAALTFVQIQALTLEGGEAGNAESTRVPRFLDALELARELSIMLYVDQKSSRHDLVLAAIQSDDYHDQALVRDDLAPVAEMAAADPELLVMAPISTEGGVDAAMAAIPNLRIVEISAAVAKPELTAAIRSRGLKVQQDVMVDGDVPAAVFGDYAGWKSYVDIGVFLPQTNYCHLLTPAVWYYRRTGEFPVAGPPHVP